MFRFPVRNLGMSLERCYTVSLFYSSCVVVEDSAIGLAAAKAAGMKCIVTKSGYVPFPDST